MHVLTEPMNKFFFMVCQVKLILSITFAFNPCKQFSPY